MCSCFSKTLDMNPPRRYFYPQSTPKPTTPGFPHTTNSFTTENTTKMSFSKAHLFPPPYAAHALFNKHLSHPARSIILLHLLEKGKAPFFELKQGIPLADSTIADHITRLIHAGLVVVLRRHPYGIYDINQQFYDDLVREMEKIHGRLKLKARNR